MKKYIVAFNFKNNIVEDDYFNQLVNTEITTIICPTFLQIDVAKQNLKTNYFLGAQNVQLNSKKAFTGEISASNLSKYNVQYCIVGHSERRNYLNESAKQIASKITELLNCNITPILCVGETEQLNDEDSINFINKQVLDIKLNLPCDCFDKICIAYEPVFSIGSGKPCKNEHINKISSFIKNNYNFSNILYGGSVNENNCEKLLNVQHLDGFLVGGASLNFNSVNKILNLLSNSNNFSFK